MFKSYIERIYRKRRLFSPKEYFYITMEGLRALEEAKSKDGPLNQLISIIKETIERKFFELSNDVPLTIIAIKATYRALKYLLR